MPLRYSDAILGSLVLTGPVLHQFLLPSWHFAVFILVLLCGFCQQLSPFPNEMPCSGTSGGQTLFILLGFLSRHTSFIVACNSSAHLSLLFVSCVKMYCQCFFLPNSCTVSRYILAWKLFFCLDAHYKLPFIHSYQEGHPVAWITQQGSPPVTLVTQGSQPGEVTTDYSHSGRGLGTRDHAPKSPPPTHTHTLFPQCISCYFRFESENGESYVVLIIFNPLIQFCFLLIEFPTSKFDQHLKALTLGRWKGKHGRKMTQLCRA